MKKSFFKKNTNHFLGLTLIIFASIFIPAHAQDDTFKDPNPLDCPYPCLIGTDGYCYCHGWLDSKPWVRE